MSASLWTLLLLGADSFFAAAGVSPLVSTPQARWRLAILFGLCDGLAVLVGAVFAAAHLDLLESRFPLGPAFAIVYGLYCLCASQWSRLRQYPRLVWLLPVLLSLDNFAAALGGHSAVSDSPVLAITSAGFAATGLYLGSFLRLPSLRARNLAAGTTLLSAGVILLLI